MHIQSEIDQVICPDPRDRSSHWPWSKRLIKSLALIQEIDQVIGPIQEIDQVIGPDSRDRSSHWPWSKRSIKSLTLIDYQVFLIEMPCHTLWRQLMNYCTIWFIDRRDTSRCSWNDNSRRTRDSCRHDSCVSPISRSSWQNMLGGSRKFLSRAILRQWWKNIPCWPLDKKACTRVWNRTKSRRWGNICSKENIYLPNVLDPVFWLAP